MFVETGFKYVIFSITHHNNLFRVMEMNALFEALGYKKPVRCVGSYDGECENSFMTTTAALDAVAQVPGFWQPELSTQESFLLVSECNKQYAALFYPDVFSVGEVVSHLGCMHAVSREEAKRLDNWTYRTDTEQFYVTTPENPDRVPPPQGWPSAERKAQVKRMQETCAKAQEHAIRRADWETNRGLFEIHEFLKEQYLE